MTNYKRFIVIVLSSALLICLPPRAGACGPYFEEAIFTRPDRPDNPLAHFARGQLGVIRPSYARSYLVVAYRYLSGVPFGPTEQHGAVDLWDERLNRTEATDRGGLQEWMDARKRASAVETAAEIKSIYRSIEQKDSYWEYLNCARDSFRTAAATLARRIDRFGPGSPEVTDWVEAQDAIYSNCSSAGKIPALAKSGLPSLIQADRAYQIAAANFYSGNFDTAAQMFKDIAADPNSPWRDLAPYLVARALVRKATLSAGPGK